MASSYFADVNNVTKVCTAYRDLLESFLHLTIHADIFPSVAHIQELYICKTMDFAKLAEQSPLDPKQKARTTRYRRTLEQSKI